jgi:hypothetical protein
MRNIVPLGQLCRGEPTGNNNNNNNVVRTRNGVRSGSEVPMSIVSQVGNCHM